MKEKFNIGVKGEGVAADGKQGKKSLGILGLIFKRLLPIGLLLSIKPVMDLIGLGINLIAFFIFKIFKFLKDFPTNLSRLNNFLAEKLVALKDRVVEWLKIVWEKIKELPGKIWEFLKALPGKIWEFLKSLPGLIWEKIVTGFTWLVESIKNLAGWIWEKVSIGFEWLLQRLIFIWTILKDKFNKLIAKVKEQITKFKTRIIDLKNKIREKLGAVITKIREKLEAVKKFLGDTIVKIKDAILELPRRIADSIKAVVLRVRNLGSRPTDVGDAIIKPNGQVIKTDPKDTIIATKTPEGVGGGTKTFNFFGVTPQEMIDVIKREMAVDVIRSSRF